MSVLSIEQESMTASKTRKLGKAKITMRRNRRSTRLIDKRRPRKVGIHDRRLDYGENRHPTTPYSSKRRGHIRPRDRGSSEGSGKNGS